MRITYKFNDQISA